MIILGIDVETTGLNPTTDVVTEVGAVLWDTDLKVPLHSAGYLVNNPEVEVPASTIALNEITSPMCAEWGMSSIGGLTRLHNLYLRADYACAHNAPFDRSFFETWAVKHNVVIEPKVWIDTKLDVPYPDKWSRRLIHVAAEHGFVNPFPHRALTDVYTMLRVLGYYDLQEVIRSAESPTIRVRADITYQDTEYREKAKSRGFHPYYKDGKFQFWWKAIKEIQLPAEKEACGFPFALIDSGYVIEENQRNSA